MIQRNPAAEARNMNTAAEDKEEEDNMMEAHLGVTTCNKCQEPMARGAACSRHNRRMS